MNFDITENLKKEDIDINSVLQQLSQYITESDN